MKTPPADLRRLVALALLGAIIFAGGLMLAFRRLPEWQAAPIPPPAGFLERFDTLSAGLSFQPSASEKPQFSLVNHAWDFPLVCGPQQPGVPSTARSYGLCVEVRQRGELPGDEQVRELSLYFSPEGLPRAAFWLNSRFKMTEREIPGDLKLRFARLLTHPGETTGPPRDTILGEYKVTLHDLPGSTPAEYLQIMAVSGGSLVAFRMHGTAAERMARETTLWRERGQNLVTILFFLGGCALFLVLVGQRHIDVVNGGILAGLTLVPLLPEMLSRDLTPDGLLLSGVFLVIKVAWIFLVWSSGESLLRSYQPTFTTSLDSLRTGRIGPRGGRALLFGLALGAILAGARMAFLSLAIDVPALWPERASLALPLTGLMGESPFGRSIVLAGTVMLLLAAFLRVLPVRWAFVAAAVAVVFVWPLPLSLHNPWAELAVEIAFAAVLVGALRTFGLTALLTASVSFYLLPAAVYASLHPVWMPWAFAGTVGVNAAFLVLGLIGLRRPPSVEEQRMVPPAFMRRREEERRLRYEMQLLARMQKGLLPEVPELPGWEIAARSIVATEAGGDLYDFLFDDDGRLWIAVGDVAGHGYSCAIVQAMTTAALTSLIRPGVMPSEVLLQVDRVIRRGGSARNFASLTLLRLDPQTGEVVLSNAGHPFPLLMLDSDVSEIVLPGLPLGKGPKRRYLDITLHLPPEAALVFCSDGLIETHDWQQTPYGFERPQEVLRGATAAPAETVLETLLADWRRHLGTEEPPDDTTIVVVRRAASIS